ncbi:MAG TPA: hypothetical protein DCM08_06285, partial [Microscillaceae bacterium]|nr:hypothetical protein [Microscillaceae bacterium]
MKLLKLFLIFSMAAFTYQAFAQVDDDDDDDEKVVKHNKSGYLKKYYPNQLLPTKYKWIIAPKIGWAWQTPSKGKENTFFREASLLIGFVKKRNTDNNSPTGALGYKAFSLGVESDFDKIHAPKIGIEANFLGWGVRSCVATYMKERRTDTRLLVELGLSIWGYANILAGWSIPLGANQGLL